MMKRNRLNRTETKPGRKMLLFLLIGLISAIMIGPLNAQTFDSGSSGINGVFPPLAPPASTTDIRLDLNNGEVTFLDSAGTVLNTATLPNTPAGGFADGVLHFTTVNVPADITLRFIGHPNNPPVKILAAEAITVDGTIDLSGKAGQGTIAVGGAGLALGGVGGPGGFKGGNGGAIPEKMGGGGSGPGGGQPGRIHSWSGAGSFGAADSFIALISLFGGSGGGGGQAISSQTGGGGGGGGILLASSSAIILNGSIQVNGGPGGRDSRNCVNAGLSGGGGGGAIRLVAKHIGGTGMLHAVGGTILGCPPSSFPGHGAPGRIRIESFTFRFSGTINPPPSQIIGVGPVAPTRNPALSSLPNVVITSIGGITPSGASASLATPDVELPQGTSNPLAVLLTASNLPVPTTFTVRVIPQVGEHSSVSSTLSVATANPGESTATAEVSLPVGEVSIVRVIVDFVVQTAGLFPLIDGEAVERIMLSANFGAPTQRIFITQSGRMVSEEEMLHRMGAKKKGS